MNAAVSTSLANAQRLGLVIVVVTMGLSWLLLWTQETYWNPLFFVGLWMGATFLMYGLGAEGYPGWRWHLVMIALSVPLWWWFELVNYRVENWEYVDRFDYSHLEYFVFASLAFSTVIPALHSAWGITMAKVRPDTATDADPKYGGWFAAEAIVGVAVLGMVFVLPDVFFPAVWAAPFLVLDGLVGLGGGHSLVRDLVLFRWRLAATIGAGGLLCGFLWEFWNFWATPKWVYHLPYLDIVNVFEMPLLGYGGYIPFAWSVYQLLNLRPIETVLTRDRRPA